MSALDSVPALLPFKEYDSIVFANELIKHRLYPGAIDEKETFRLKSRAGVSQPITTGIPLPEPTDGIETGTFKGSQKALTAAYAGIVSTFNTYFDIAGFEPSLPRSETSLEVAKDQYNWTQPSADDNYPPHLAIIPAKDSVGMLKIFNILRLATTAPLLSKVIPASVLDFLYSDPDHGGSIQSVVQRNHTLRTGGSGLFAQANIGDRDDWFTDAVFGQQQLTGTSPATLEKATDALLSGFIAAARNQQNGRAVELLTATASDSNRDDGFYVQDYSWFRQAIGLGATDIIQDETHERKTAAPIALFHLTARDGILHPLAIVIDYKGAFEDSVVLYNQRLRVTDNKSGESEDWPWRYAKTVVQCADWHRHEVGVHLTESHFVEEATIVAANRAFPERHIVYRLLSPHWFKTLSLNASARTALVPQVVVPVAGMAKDQIFKLAQYVYKNFDFVRHNVPNDLLSRGFPSSANELQGTKYHNYAYARDISLFWTALREFVAAVLENEYKADADVINDERIKAWYMEMQDPMKGNMKGFPTITKVDHLIDAVTGCIHIASPFHSAINYLQNYYYAFVIHKPPALYSDIPGTLVELQKFKERDLLKALPIGQAREWLMASHIPWLLSFQVAENQNILTWAASLANASSRNSDEEKLHVAASKLYNDLIQMADFVKANSEALDDQGTPYTVLMPKQVAVSILI